MNISSQLKSHALQSEESYRDKEGHCIMTKWSILRKVIALMYMHPTRTSKYVRKKLVELLGEIDKSTIIVEDFNASLSEMVRSSRQKISKDIVELNSTMNQLDIIDIDQLFYIKTAKKTHSSQNHIKHYQDRTHLGYNTHLNKFKRTGIRECLLLDHNGIKLEIKTREIVGKSQNTWRLNNILLNKKWVK